MDATQVVNVLKEKFSESGQPLEIPLLKGSNFMATMTQDGINVDNLGAQPHLPWAVFEEAICLLVRKNGRAKRGDAMGSRLGDTGLPLDSVEGHVAQAVYGKRHGDTVFRRITPIACILVWAGICDTAPHELLLRKWAIDSCQMT